MTEHVLSILAYENRQILAEYLLIISISYIAVIIAIIYIGQRTRIIIPDKKSRTMCRQNQEHEAVFAKYKASKINTGFNSIMKEHDIHRWEASPSSNGIMSRKSKHLGRGC